MDKEAFEEAFLLTSCLQATQPSGVLFFCSLELFLGKGKSGLKWSLWTHLQTGMVLCSNQQLISSLKNRKL